MKYCTDCKHFGRAHQWYPFDMCYRKETRDMIGRFQTANGSRLGPCGEDAIYWEEKQPEPPAVPAPSLWQRLRATFKAGERP